ncbi:MAG TPA: hypothetical protein VGP26_29305 [Actinophytocola sp.]|nr:hypothetical protein [Actinophytocola sp.]
MQPGQPPPPGNDPYRAVWQMNQVGQEMGPRRRFGNLRLVAGIIAGLVAFMPFGVATSAVWGWWSGESDLNGAGWAIIVLGLAAGLGVGGFVASESSND